ncbi:MAG: hypothetical protein KIT08_01370 [Anaerolineales bacterium]|nr:MAG: hypothetical protein KIT08_01370 [Anaerolineales bacterium]
MTEQTEEQKKAEETAENKVEQGASAETKNAEHLIPKHRFDEVNERAKKAEAELDALKQAEKQAEEKRLADQQQYKELADKREAELKDLQAKTEADKKAAEEQAKKVKYEADVIAEAAKLNFHDPKEAIALLGDAEDVAKAVKELAEAKPHLINKKVPPRLPFSRQTETTDETPEQKRKRLIG